MNNIRTGNTQECLVDYFKTCGSSKALAKFVGVEAKTERRWRTGETVPVGETMLRLQYFLIFSGYHLVEFNNLPECLVLLGIYIALDIVNIEDVGKKMGLYEHKRIYEYFRKEVGIVPEKEEIIIQILSENNGTLLSVLNSENSKYGSVFGPKKLNTDPSLDNKILEEFSEACKKVRELGKKLLDGRVEIRIAMRDKMGTGPEPKLQLTWETLNMLLREKTIYEH